MPIMVNFNSNGLLKLLLPEGPASDSYKLKLMIKIIDDLDGMAIYNISTTVAVHPNATLANEIKADILNQNASSMFTGVLESSSLQYCAPYIIGFASMINNEALNAINTTEYNSNNVIISLDLNLIFFLLYHSKNFKIKTDPSGNQRHRG